jgi:UDP-glucose 4-epimerase
VLNGDGSARRDFIWMKDVARVVHEALSPDCFLNDCYNLSFGKSLRIADVAKVVVSAYVSEYSKLLPINIDLACVPAADSLVVDNSKLLSEIDFVFSDRLESEARLIMTMLKGANDG